MPFFRPRVLTTSSLVGTSMLRRGGMAMPESTLGTSSSLLPVPTTASPLRTNGEAFSIRIWWISLPLSSDRSL